MTCHVCQAEAVTRCYTCGQLICEDHGGKDDLCTQCSTGIVAGKPGSPISEKPISDRSSQGGWWRPQEAEAYAPPACYECKGLARARCRNCLCHYCSEHAGPNGLCKACAQSANVGIYVFVGLFALLITFYMWHWFSRGG
jgi:hypothetical protein